MPEASGPQNPVDALAPAADAFDDVVASGGDLAEALRRAAEAAEAGRDATDRELLRLQTFEPVSENPVFSFDFPSRPAGTLRIVGTDNNGNRIDAKLE